MQPAEEPPYFRRHGRPVSYQSPQLPREGRLLKLVDFPGQPVRPLPLRLSSRKGFPDRIFALNRPDL